MREQIKSELRQKSSEQLSELLLLIQLELYARWEFEQDNLSEALLMLEEDWVL